MYVPIEEKHTIANKIVDYFKTGNMVCFAKFSAELYEKYDEFTADDIMAIVRINILQLKSI